MELAELYHVLYRAKETLIGQHLTMESSMKVPALMAMDWFDLPYQPIKEVIPTRDGLSLWTGSLSVNFHNKNGVGVAFVEKAYGKESAKLVVKNGPEIVFISRHQDYCPLSITKERPEEFNFDKYIRSGKWMENTVFESSNSLWKIWDVLRKRDLYLGKITLTETLFRAWINPRDRAMDILQDRVLVSRLSEASIKTYDYAVRFCKRGTYSDKYYPRPRILGGDFLCSVYGRAGEACRVCSKEILAKPVPHCSKCQKRRFGVGIVS